MHAILQWFDDPHWTRLGMTLIHFLWEGALLGLAAAALMVWMRRAPSYRRYAVLLATLSAMAAAVIATFSLLPTPANEFERTQALAAVSMPVEAHTSVAPPLPNPSTPHIGTASNSSNDRTDDRSSESGVSRSFAWGVVSAWRWTFAHLSWFVAAWVAGVGLFTIRFAIGLRGAGRIRRVEVATAPDFCRAQCTELSKRLRLHRVADVCQSALVQVPVVVGYLSPIVLLPASVIAGLPESELRAILAH
jgi:beta-lactamase regulating signal transducer with metallopeptidase domain